MIYDLLKFLHIAIAIVWLGGGFAMVFLGSAAARASDHDSMLSIARNSEFLAKRIFIPASVLILILGSAMVWMQWSFLDAWVVIGIIGVISTGLIGGCLLSPLLEKMSTLNDSPEAAALAGKILQKSRGDYIVLGTIVWDMVSRPQWDNVIEISIILVVIAIGLIISLR